MPGPTTEVLNDDIKEVKGDLRELRSDLNVVKADVHAIALGLAELRAEFRVTVGIARWAGTLLVATILGGGVSAIWWAGTITADLKRISARLDIPAASRDAAKPARGAGTGPVSAPAAADRPGFARMLRAEQDELKRRHREATDEDERIGIRAEYVINVLLARSTLPIGDDIEEARILRGIIDDPLEPKAPPR